MRGGARCRPRPCIRNVVCPFEVVVSLRLELWFEVRPCRREAVNSFVLAGVSCRVTWATVDTFFFVLIVNFHEFVPLI